MLLACSECNPTTLGRLCIIFELSSMLQLQRYLSVTFTTFLPAVFIASGLFSLFSMRFRKPKGQVWEKNIFQTWKFKYFIWVLHTAALVTWLNSWKFGLHAVIYSCTKSSHASIKVGTPKLITKLDLHMYNSPYQLFTKGPYNWSA